MGEPVQGRGGIKDQTGLTALITDQREAAIHVSRGLGVKGDDIGPSLGKRRDQTIDRLTIRWTSIGTLT